MLAPTVSLSSISVIIPRSKLSPTGKEPFGIESSIETGSDAPNSISASIRVLASVPCNLPLTLSVCTSARPISRLALKPAKLFCPNGIIPGLSINPFE